MIFQRLIAGGGSAGGNAGNPVASGVVSVDGELILTLQDGSTVNCGVVADGAGNPVVSGAVNGSGELVMTLQSGSTVNCGVVSQDLTAELAKLSELMVYRQSTKLSQAAGVASVINFVQQDLSLKRDVHAYVLTPGGQQVQTAADFINGEASDFNSTPAMVFDGAMKPNIEAGSLSMVNSAALDSGRVFSCEVSVAGLNAVRISGVV